MWAIVPLKSPDNAKSRLARVLAPPARRSLFFAMAEQVLHALAATPGIGRILVVTSSPEVEHFAGTHGVHVLHQAQDAGTAHACRFALGSGLLEAQAPVLFVSGDLPLASSSEFGALLRRAQSVPSTPSIVVAPDRHRQGTNALWCSGTNVVTPSFGTGSFARHIEQAHATGVAVAIHEATDLALDIDEPADLRYLREVLTAVRGRSAAHRAAAPNWNRWLEAIEPVTTA